MSAKVAVAGAGIYGATIALRLAQAGHRVQLFDPLGILHATSVINQYRIHSGYHYPRSPETITETLEARAEFTAAYAPAIVRNSRHYYAIPKEGSLTPPDLFEKVMAQHALACKPVRPDWMDFGFIDKCYEVDEQIYDPDVLRDTVSSQIQERGIPFEPRSVKREERSQYDFLVWATYGLGPSLGLFPNAKYQVAEKILIDLPPALQHISLVIVDGPFTAFDPYGSTRQSLFGSAKNTNHWTTQNPHDPIPEPFAHMLNGPRWEKFDHSRFEAMRRDSMLAVPASKGAVYIGSRFTIRVVENNPISDRRTLYVQETSPGEIHIFSGKVVGAVKAARLVCERVAKG
jgi:FAD dependent oxidoreductase